MPKETLTVRELRVRAVNVPMAVPHRTSSGTITSSPLVLTDVLTHEGVEGHSCVFTYTPLALQPVALLVKNLELLIKDGPAAPQAVNEQLHKRFRLLGPQGLTGIAMAAIDMALWDALARSVGLSLAALLGGEPRPIPAYGAIGYDGIDGSAKTAEQWAKLGFRAVKAKIGYASVEEDVAVVRAIRRAVGNDVAIMVDYNQSLSIAEAIERCLRLDGEGLTWIEEPVLANDYDGHAQVARAVRTPIQAGENWWGPRDLLQAVKSLASDHLMLDVMKIGGVTGWMRGAAIAEAHGLQVSNHLFPEISAQLLSVTSTSHMLEYADWWNPILEKPLIIEHGNAVPGGAPGSGVAWDEQAVEHYLV